MNFCVSRLSATIAIEWLAATVLHASVFYVDPETGRMDNDGSAEHPWKTVQQVFEQNLIQTQDAAGRLKNEHAPVKAGDTILLCSGYHGEINCRVAYNDEFITIAAQVGHKPRVRRVFFSQAGKWIIRGLTVSPSFAAEYKPDRLIYIVD